MRNEPRLINAARVLADLTAVVAAFAAAFAFYRWLIVNGVLPGRSMPDVVTYAPLCAAYALAFVFCSWRIGLYPPIASVLNLWETRAVFRAVAISVSFFLAAIFLLKLEGSSRIVILVALTLVAPLVLIERRVFAAYLRYRRGSGSMGEQVVIVGCGETGRLLMKKVLDAPHLGYALVGFLDPDLPIGTPVTCTTNQATLSTATRKVLGRPDDLEAISGNQRVDQILVDESRLSTEQSRRVLDEAARLGIRVGVVPNFMQRHADEFYLEDLSAIPVLRPHNRHRGNRFRRTKRAMDVAGAAVLLFVTAPVFLLSMILIRMGSEGPVFFKHQRIGLLGRPFDILKFRTMYVTVDPYALSPEGDNDRRITGFGRVLRSTGLDELPQLINVLLGDMSLVGPRPEMPFIVEGYDARERRRLQVKPGITGLWQLSPDRHQQIHENLEYDLYYINHVSPFLDGLILVETLFVTMEIALLKLFGRERAVDEGPATVPLPAEATAANPYVLVALDQRIAHTGDLRWKQGLKLALGMSEPYPVKFLATVSNQPRARAVISRARGGHTNGSRIDCVPVAGPRDVQSFVDRAALVVTDLPNVASWAEERGKRLLTVGPEA